MKKNFLIYSLFFLSLLLISIFSQVDLDGVWGYGFSYNIASGLIPYKDFNMVIGPLYSIIFSIPMHFFGNYYFLFELEHVLIYSFIFTLIYRKIGKDTIYLLFNFGCCLTIFGYNLFCVMMMMLILVLLDSNLKYRKILIGLVIGIILMTKHNIGLLLFLVYIYDNRKSLFNCFSTFIPVAFISIYLLVNNILFEYFDFCFFGLGNFLSNLSTDFLSFVPYFLFLFPLVKSYLKNKEIKVLYILAFQIIIFPIFDQGHIIPAFIPIVYYFLQSDCIKNKFWIKLFFSIGFVTLVIIKPLIECDFITSNNYLKFQFIRKDISTYISSYSSYIDDLYSDGSKVYLLVDNAYIIRLYRNENPDFYDLINKGNLGSDDSKYVNIMGNDCKNKKCYFILDYYFFHPRLFDQRNTIFKDYVLSEYRYIETMPSGDKIYTNK